MLITDEYVEVEIAVAVSDNTGAEIEQERFIEVCAQGIGKPANDIAASLGITPEDALLDVKTCVDGKLLAAEIVKVRVKRV